MPIPKDLHLNKSKTDQRGKLADVLHNAIEDQYYECYHEGEDEDEDRDRGTPSCQLIAEAVLEHWTLTAK